MPIPRLWRRLQRYIERGRPKDANSDRIFLSARRDRRTGEAGEALTWVLDRMDPAKVMWRATVAADRDAALAQL